MNPCSNSEIPVRVLYYHLIDEEAKVQINGLSDVIQLISGKPGSRIVLSQNLFVECRCNSLCAIYAVLKE